MGAKRGERVGCRELGEELRKSRKGQEEEQGLCNDHGYFVAKLWDCLHDLFYIFAAMLKWFVNDEVAIQVQRNKVLIEEEQVEPLLEDENVDVEQFLQ